jgi:inositol-1,3,4-trisphosphate 5/6-kinase/inositol-tetrakisphosphate 1-kinase
VLVDVQCTDVAALLPTEFKFPAICKSVQASGAAEAHKMAIVWSLSDLNTFKRPYILQEYINHNATVFKVYVVGSEFHVVIRPSFPNLPTTPQPPIHFNSQDTKTALPPILQTDYAATQPPPSRDLLQRITTAIANYFHLTLFGYDVLVNVTTQKIAVVDVNYFPGKCGCSGTSGVFFSLLFSTLHILSLSFIDGLNCWIGILFSDYKGVDGVYEKLFNHFTNRTSSK